MAALLTACKAIRDHGLVLPVDVHPLLTITEEIGSGASAALHGEIAEMVSLDVDRRARAEHLGACGDDLQSGHVGPFDYHLTHKLIALAKAHGIAHRRDIFRYYRSDSAAAVEAGNDIRTALIGFGADASHSQERTHRDALEALTKLVIAYMTSEPVARRDCRSMGSMRGLYRRLLPGRHDGAEHATADRVLPLEARLRERLGHANHRIYVVSYIELCHPAFDSPFPRLHSPPVMRRRDAGRAPQQPSPESPKDDRTSEVPAPAGCREPEAFH